MTRASLSFLLTMASGLALWQSLVLVTDVPPYLLPSPARVARAASENAGLLLEHAGVTIAEILVGLAGGVMLGGLTALAIMLLPVLQRTLMPWLLVSQAIPVFALAPLLVLWFGYGMASKVAMAMLIIYFPVASNLLDGLRRTDPGLLDLARTMNARPWRVLLSVRLPAALPAFASGLRLAAVYAPVGAVIGEWVGASSGLGYLMLLANARMKIDLMFAALAVLAALTVALYLAAGRLAAACERYALGHPAAGSADGR